MHEHTCEHELKYCKHCDVVFCKKCKREWGRGYPYFVYTQPYNPYPWTGTWITCGTTATDIPDGTTYTYAHSHT